MWMLILSMLTAPAAAQTTTTTAVPDPLDEGGFDAHGFRLVSFDADPRDPLRLQRVGDLEAGSWYAGVLGEYANRPLVFQPGDTLEVALSDLAAANVTGGVVAAEQVRFDLSLPVYLASNGASGSQGAGLGDVRVSSLVALLQPGDANGLGLGAVAALDVPTGDPGDYLGSTGVAGLLAAALTVEQDQLTLSAQAGGRLAPNSDPDVRPAPTEGGDTIEAAGAVGYLLSQNTGLTLEAQVSVPLDPSVQAAIGVPAEATLSTRHVLASGAQLSAGIGVGLGQGAGASPIRVLVGGGFGSAPPADKDTDSDGIFDRDDACIDQPESMNGFQDDDGCPEQLPMLTLRAELDGEGVDDAVLEATVDGEAVSGTGELALAVIPGKQVTVSAVAGECLRASRELTSGEVAAAVAIDLERVLGSVEVTVANEQGDALVGAQVKYMVDDQRCLPEDRAVPEGKATHAAGPGAYQVFVTAAGYGVHQQEVTVVEGETVKVEAVLAPALQADPRPGPALETQPE